MKNHYYNLLSPLKINDSVVLKNRMLSSSSVLHFLQGPEQYPTDAMITHLANRAKSGAAMVTCRGVSPRSGKSVSLPARTYPICSTSTYTIQNVKTTSPTWPMPFISMAQKPV